MTAKARPSLWVLPQPAESLGTLGGPSDPQQPSLRPGPSLMVVARPRPTFGSVVGSPSITPSAGAISAAGVAPIIPKGSVSLTVPATTLGIIGRPANLGNVFFRPGLMVIASQRAVSVPLSDPNAVVVDSIDSSARTQYQRPSAIIDGHNFKSSQGGGSVKIGGVTQTIVSWSDTAIEIGPVERGTLRYGDYDLTVTNDDNRSASLTITLEPASGWFYVNLGISDDDVNTMVPTDPALEASTNYTGWQLAYGNFSPPGPGYAVVYSDATFAYGNGLASFDAELNNGTGWGTTGSQEFNVDVTPDTATAISLSGYAPTLGASTNTFIGPLVGSIGVTGAAPTLTETTSRNFTIPAGALRFRYNKPQGRAMYGLGSGGLGTGGLAGRNRDELTAGIGISENIQ